MVPCHGAPAPERRMRGGHPSLKAPVSKDCGGASVGGLYEKDRAERRDEKHDLCGFPDSCEV